MNFYKIEKNGYIHGISRGAGEGNITEAEYTQIADAIRNRPTPPEGYDYLLRTDLTWELTELPPVPDEPTVYTQAVLERMTNAELAEILVGYGRSASMNKENMVALILQLQGGDAK